MKYLRFLILQDPITLEDAEEGFYDVNSKIAYVKGKIGERKLWLGGVEYDEGSKEFERKSAIGMKRIEMGPILGNLYRCRGCFDSYVITKADVVRERLYLYGFNLTENCGPHAISAEKLERPGELTEEEIANLTRFQLKHPDLHVAHISCRE